MAVNVNKETCIIKDNDDGDGNNNNTFDQVCDASDSNGCPISGEMYEHIFDPGHTSLNCPTKTGVGSNNFGEMCYYVSETSFCQEGSITIVADGESAFGVVVTVHIDGASTLACRLHSLTIEVWFASCC